jgi:hypothetical protein
MSGSSCGAAARLLVTVSTDHQSSLVRHCSRCKRSRPFASSGKFRVNAQKKRIDAWLIFRCTDCDERWNWPIHERRSVATLDPDEFDALMRNDVALAAHHAAAAVRQCAEPSAASADPTVTLTVLTCVTVDTTAIVIMVAVKGAVLRLDRLLARALMLGRGEIETLAESAGLTVQPAGRKALRRPAIDGQRISIDLACYREEMAARLRARLSQLPDL